MRFRRRFTVVVEGVSGQAAAQRSVISEHRSEQDAREAAARERARLEVIHGGSAREWRILVMEEDRLVAEEVPSAEGEDLLAAAVSEAPRQPEPPTPPSEEADAQAAGEEADEEPATPPEPPEPPPEGPVPDWVIRRFEESIARRGDREGGPEDADEDGAAGA